MDYESEMKPGNLIKIRKKTSYSNEFNDGVGVIISQAINGVIPCFKIFYKGKIEYFEHKELKLYWEIIPM